jgi:hypothetical protein
MERMFKFQRLATQKPEVRFGRSCSGHPFYRLLILVMLYQYSHTLASLVQDEAIWQCDELAGENIGTVADFPRCDFIFECRLCGTSKDITTCLTKPQRFSLLTSELDSILCDTKTVA